MYYFEDVNDVSEDDISYCMYYLDVICDFRVGIVDIRVMLIDKKCSNQFTRSIPTNGLYHAQSCRNHILNTFDKPTIGKLRTKFFKYPVPPKTKEIHYKIMNDFYPSSEFLESRFGFESNECIFCKGDMETSEHLFVSCSHTHSFWKQFIDWLNRKKNCDACSGV